MSAVKTRFSVHMTDAELATWRRLARERGCGGSKLMAMVARIFCADAALLDGILDGYPVAVSGAVRQRAILRQLAARDDRTEWVADLAVEYQVGKCSIRNTLRAMEAKGLVTRDLAPRATHRGVYACARVTLTAAGLEAAEGLE